ncbi:HPr family phosphocarrier protein [Microbacterium sp. NPDC058342]|uniref:HPr family phosphocarrier protein n=1 Tax=Microbacterium sp. NPDC058342 TaxID=3346454 RepID=UPI00365CCF70
MTEVSRTITIASAQGLHARPAKLFAETARDAGVPVTVAKGEGRPANAASILAVLALGAGHGDTVTLTASGEDAESVLDRLQQLLETDHDEE